MAGVGLLMLALSGSFLLTDAIPGFSFNDGPDSLINQLQAAAPTDMVVGAGTVIGNNPEPSAPNPEPSNPNPADLTTAPPTTTEAPETDPGDTAGGTPMTPEGAPQSSLGTFNIRDKGDVTDNANSETGDTIDGLNSTIIELKTQFHNIPACDCAAIDPAIQNQNSLSSMKETYQSLSSTCSAVSATVDTIHTSVQALDGHESISELTSLSGSVDSYGANIETLASAAQALTLQSYGQDTMDEIQTLLQQVTSKSDSIASKLSTGWEGTYAGIQASINNAPTADELDDLNTILTEARETFNLRAAQDTERGTKSSVQNVESQLGQIKNGATTHSDSLGGLTSSLNTMEGTLSSLTSTASEWETKISHLESTLAGTDDVEQQINTIEQLTSHINGAVDVINGVDTSSAETQLSSMESKVSGWSSQLQSAEASNNNVQSTLEDLKSAVNQLTQSANSDASMSASSSIPASITAARDDLNDRVSQKQNQYLDTLQSMSHGVSGLSSSVVSAHSSLSAVKDNYNQLQNTISSLQSKVDSYDFQSDINEMYEVMDSADHYLHEMKTGIDGDGGKNYCDAPFTYLSDWWDQICVRFNYRELDWFEAYAECKRWHKDGRLVVFDTDGERQLVADKLYDLDISDNFHIGLVLYDTWSGFKWIGGNDPYTIRASWQPGEPGNGGSGQLCGNFWSDYSWWSWWGWEHMLDDGSCTTTKYSICEIPL